MRRACPCTGVRRVHRGSLCPLHRSHDSAQVSVCYAPSKAMAQETAAALVLCERTKNRMWASSLAKMRSNSDANRKRQVRDGCRCPLPALPSSPACAPMLSSRPVFLDCDGVASECLPNPAVASVRWHARSRAARYDVVRSPSGEPAERLLAGATWVLGGVCAG